jgi:NADH:ubiquinone oxidoreductase subunit 3 (subunit A)
MTTGLRVKRGAQGTMTRTQAILLPSLCALMIASSEGLKHSFAVTKDKRSFIAPIGNPFGFLPGGCFGLDVFDFELTTLKWVQKKSTSEQQDILDQVEAGFLLKKFNSESDFANYQEILMTNSTGCIFDPFRNREEDPIFEDDDIGDVGDILSAGTDGIYIRLVNSSSSVMYQFKPGEEGLYILMYQVCSTKSIYTKMVRSTFELDFHYRNYDRLGRENYLPAGETALPAVFMYFSVSYAVCLFVWMSNIRRIQSGLDSHFSDGGRPIVYPVHQLMTVLLMLKTVSIFFESVRYYYIAVSGHAELWSVVYYGINFLKGMFLFTVILLIGSGWSIVKPFLSDREKKIICLVLTLQVLDNIAVIVLSRETEGSSFYEDWSALLHLVDILCCCAVLVPIVWQVKALEESVKNAGEGVPSGDDARILSKLKLLRSFYLSVVAYIYFTRIVVYLFATVLDYRHTWLRYFITELATLAFYTVTGVTFRPRSENAYEPVQDDDSEATIVFVHGEEVEMGSTELYSKGN